MSTYVYMKILESAPSRYDLGMRMLSFGRITAAYDAVAAAAVDGSSDVLEIGCGTGNLTARLLARGARVVAVDSNPEMLALARRKLAVFDQRLELKEMAAVEIADRFPAESFDAVVSMLAFSEMSADERDYVAQGARGVLRRGGRMVVADEERPTALVAGLLHGLLRLPVVAITYLFTQTTTHAIPDLARLIARGGFRVLVDRRLPGGIGLVVAERPKNDPGGSQ
jgi:demethylmenaquinone methyltransferase/2-methoxy-6-polyprenyl-1,4-benzoquinol methylase